MAGFSTLALLMASAIFLPAAVAKRSLEKALSTLGAAENKSENKFDLFGEQVDLMREVDTYKKGDRYVIFNSDGMKLTLLANPPTEQASFNNFKADLLKCGPNGKICIGFYSIQAPMNLQSSTPKQKTLLVKMVDEDAIRAKLKSMIKTKGVVMGTVTGVWNPLQKAIGMHHISPTKKLELGDASEVNELTPEGLWAELATGISRIGAGEEAAFVKHIKERNSGAGGQVLSDEEDDAADAVNEVETSSPVTPPSATPAEVTAPSVVSTAGSADAKEVKALQARVAKLEQQFQTKLEAAVAKEVEKYVEKYSKKAAAQEVADALQRLAQETKKVGKETLDKAK